MGMKRTPTAAPESLAPVVHRHRELAPQVNGELIPGFGNLTGRDIVLPQLKLLQGMTPIVKEDPRQFPQGEWHHSTLGAVLGKHLNVVALQVQSSHVLWAPRDSGEGRLAMSMDGVHWEPGGANQEFRVRLKGGREVIWRTRNTLPQSGLDRFGTSDPSNPKSPPAAALTYNIVLWLLDKPELSPCMYIVSRMAALQTQKELISRVNMRYQSGTPFFAQRYQLSATNMVKGPNEFYVPAWINAGDIESERERAKFESIAQAMRAARIRTADDRPDEEVRGDSEGDYRGRNY